MNRMSPPPDRSAAPRAGLARHAAAAALGGVAFALRTVRPRVHSTPGGTRTVLILEPFGMGDVLSHEPLVRALHGHGWSVIFCAQAAWRDLLPPECVSGWINAHMPWSRYDLRRKYRPTDLFGSELRNTLRELRAAGRGAIGLDTRGDMRSVILLYLAGCSEVWTLSHYLAVQVRTFRWAARMVPARNTPRWQQNLDFLGVLGVTPGDGVSRPRLVHLCPDPVSPAARTVALIPLSPWPGKWWPGENWRRLSDRLAGLGWRPVGLCGPGQESLAAAALGDRVPIEVCSSVRGWTDRLRRVEAAISVNTGPMHIADALDKALVVLEGSGRIPLWAPSNPRSRLIHHQEDFPCAPCHQTGAATSCAAACMAAITEDEVLQALHDATAA